MVDWNIQSRADACESCGKPFADKDVFHTLLFDRKDCYSRSDICTGCWTHQYGQGATDRKGFVSCWQSVYTVPPTAPPEPIQKENAESLLRKLIDQGDPSHEGARFILAVMLERKRLLKVKAQLMDHERRTFVYEHAKTGDLFHIIDPNLRLAQLEMVQRDVADLLEHGCEPKAAAQTVADSEWEAVPDPTSIAADVETAPNLEEIEPAQEPSIG